MNDPDTLPPAPERDLAGLAALLLSRISASLVRDEARRQDLDEAIREAETWQRRRAAHSARDRACYRIGEALEPKQGHLLDDLALTGFDHLGALGLLLLAEVALGRPGASVSELLEELFASEHGDSLRAWGAWVRAQWLQRLYDAETDGFLASVAAKDPKARWRRRPVTARQRYLAGQIARSLGLPEPALHDRGGAFDWIGRHGGDERLSRPPPAPPLPRSSAGGAA